MNDDVCGTCNKNCQIKCKTTMLKSRVCEFSDAYILAEETITAVGQGADDGAIAAGGNNEQVVFKKLTRFTDCISKINNILCVIFYFINFNISFSINDRNGSFVAF